jgi:hypothetical protein
MVDITDETRPVPVSTWQVPGLDTGEAVAQNTGAHQPAENFVGDVMPVAYFAQGRRLLDISDPTAMREIGHYVPEALQGFPRVATNDVTLGPDGLIYIIDRNRGLTVLERT